jgi:hypothetical protein
MSIFDYSVFTDCGAPSLYNKLSKKEKDVRGVMGSTFKDRKYDDYSYTETDDYNEFREGYIKFLLENRDKVNAYSNLDVINNPKLTLRNQKILEEAGLDPIPVWHLGSDEKYLKWYIKKYPYIAIGGLVPNPTTKLYGWLDKLFKEHILDSDGFPKVKTHGFACTAVPLMTRFPWFSVDSATCRKLGMYGWIVLPEHGSGDLKTVRISSRDISLKDRFRKTPSMLREIENRVERYGMTLKGLSDNLMDRVIWNYLIYSETIEERVPDWPWNYYTREIKGEVINERLHYYFAGSLSKKEERKLWQSVADKNIMVKGRLQSFFYKASLEYIISLKHNQK